MLGMNKSQRKFVKLLLIISTLSLLLGILFMLLSNKKPTSSAEEYSTMNDVSNVENIKNTEVISPIALDYLRSLTIDSAAPIIEQELTPGSNYKRYIASYISEGNKIYGLLTIPNTTPPEGGFSAIVFNHGYIPPSQYVTTERYVAYVDALAKNNFIVFKIDMRGHGDSEGNASGSYFSSGYTIDAISAVKSLQKMQEVNPNKIGMWGHSMAGNLLLRAMLITEDIKAGVIWAGAVYSYEDFAKYRLSDNSYVRRPTATDNFEDINRDTSPRIQMLRESPEDVNFDDTYWSSISLTQNISYLKHPIQLHHAVNDSTVNVGYSRDLEAVLKNNAKEYEYYEYTTGGHDIEGASFDVAMQRTIDFFKDKL